MSKTCDGLPEEALAIAKELADVLEVGLDEVLCYVCMLLGLSVDYNAAAERDGLIIIGHDNKPVPLHPRMAISNLYRISLAKDPSVAKRRTRVDELIAKLISISGRG